MADAPLASLSLTHVHYNPGDRLSYFCAFLALVPQGLCVAYATLIWSTREAEIILMFAGQMACEGCNWGLKRWIKEERPRQMNGKGYGMPSSHAQFVTFFSIYLCFFLLLRHRPHPTSTNTPSTTLFERVSLSFLSLVSAAAVASSRVYLNYHTPKQVAIGCGAGAVLALAWFMATTVARRTGLLSWGLDLPLARVFRLRDLVVHQDLADAGWEKWETMRSARSIDDVKKAL